MSWSAFAAWDLGTVAISYIRHGAEVIIRPGRLESFYAVSTPVKGSAISRFGHSETKSAPQSAVVHPPTQEIAMRWSADCENLALRIDRCALEAELSCMLRQDIDAPVMFEQLGGDLGFRPG